MNETLQHVWQHRTSDGQDIGEIRRYIGLDGKKRDFPCYQKKDQGFGSGIPTGLKPYPLFGLETLKDSTQPVIIVEGQKCQAALAGLGFQSITSILGAANAGCSDWSTLEEAENILLLPDNDEPGEKYVRNVYELLSTLNGSRNIAVVRLPALPEKGDVCDWIKAELPEWDELRSLASDPERARIVGLLIELLISGAEEVPDTWIGIDDRRPGGSGFSKNFSTSSGDWPDPVPLKSELLPVPELSEELIPESLQGWCKDVAHRMQVPLSFAAASALIVAGSIIGAGCGIRPKRNDDWLVVPNLWGAIVARPGKLKSPMLMAITEPLRKLETECAAVFKEDWDQYQIELAEYQNRQAAIREMMKKAAKDEESGSV